MLTMNHSKNLENLNTFYIVTFTIFIKYRTFPNKTRSPIYLWFFEKITFIKLVLKDHKVINYINMASPTMESINANTMTQKNYLNFSM